MSSPFSDGIFYPQDVELLRRTFARICTERGYEASGMEAHSVATLLMDLHRRGVSSEDELFRQAGI